MYLDIGLYIAFELFSGAVVSGSVYLIDRKAHSAYNVSVTAEVADIDKQRPMSGQGIHRSSGVTYYVVYSYTAAAVYAAALAILVSWLISKIKKRKQGLQE